MRPPVAVVRAAHCIDTRRLAGRAKKTTPGAPGYAEKRAGFSARTAISLGKGGYLPS